ncbi:MAG TPA: response regulator [Kofleriaceae bacterium]|nr:response regulator [Kofleriaceae bacterium]
MRLLVVEDSDDDYEILLRELKRGGVSVDATRVASAGELTRALEQSWDLMVTDWMLPSFGGLQALEMVAARKVDLPCIVISGTPNEEAAVEALRAGALDFLSKDKPLRFVPAIERAMREAEERRARLEAEKELRFSEQRFRAAFDYAPEAIITYDFALGRIVDVNERVMKLFGYTREQFHAMPVGGLSPPVQPDGRPSAEIAAANLERARRGPISNEWMCRDADGNDFPTEVIWSMLPTSGEPLLRISIVDLRERKRAEELRRRAIELELQNRRIQEANRLKSEFLANMSHELRTPLNAIIGFAELLHDGQVPTDSPQHTEFLGDILASGRHLLQLINDVLDLAKVEAGKLDFRPEPIDVVKVLGEIVSITRATASGKRIKVVTEIDPSIRTVTLDPSRFKQVAYNYVSNALKFTPEGGRITIRAKPENDLAFRLEVQDTGVGISATDLGRLFVEFQQLDAGAAKRHQGTGLGLALTRRLVEAQGGTVGVKSTQGEGSVFHAVLPRSARSSETPVLSRTSMGSRLGQRTVLVVEDEIEDTKLVVDALTSAGYAVETVSNAAEAVAVCRSRTFDAVTLDLVLPDMTGLDLLAMLRAEPHMRTTPVIVVTVIADAKLVAGFAVQDVLRKPLEPHSLLSALERAGVRPDRPGGILVVDDDLGALRLMDATLAQLGFAAITRSNGQAGLEAAEQLKPSAVVLDLMMPGMDGVEFLDRFRRMPAHVRTPVLIWTMKDLTADEHAKLHQSAQGVMSKNGDTPSTVIAQLRALLPLEKEMSGG